MGSTGNTSGEPIECAADVEAVFRAERRRLWGLAYRLAGDAGDADDLVQEAFTRLLAHRPAPPRPGPWLVRVVTNLGLDLLRRRRRRAYAGPWLPSPIETDAEPLELPATGGDPEARYGLAESATYAFLIALEALAPRPRAVLLLRDVLGSSVQETADLLGVSEGNVRILHHRARRALAEYDRSRCVPSAELRARHRAVLERFLEGLRAQDGPALEALLAESVQTVTDAGGEYTALATPLAGRARVARFYRMAALHRQEGGTSTEIRLVNELPAALVVVHRPVRRQAPRSLLRCDLDGEGRIARIHAILAPRKLEALRFA